MAKQKLTIDHALRLTIHHVSPHKLTIMEVIGRLDAMTVGNQFSLVRGNCEAIRKQLEKIKTAAEAGDCVTVLRLINEESVEAGHNYAEEPANC